MGTLADLTAVVCGSSQGIGRACAEALAAAGARVILIARNSERLQEAQTALSTANGQSHEYRVADFADHRNVKDLAANIADEFKTIHIVINNTGGPPSGPLLEADSDSILQGISNHLLCNQHLVQALVPGMKAAQYGRIINIISTSVLMPIAGLGVSNTVRGAVANWARTLAGELAPFEITVNNILPGFTDTARLSTLFEKKAQRLSTTPEAVKSQTIDSIPMQRMGRPEEIGAVAAFLASPLASYISGVNLPVDGARTATQR